MTTDKNQTIWKWGNTAHITKMSIEGTVALASLYQFSLHNKQIDNNGKKALLN